MSGLSPDVEMQQREQDEMDRLEKRYAKPKPGTTLAMVVKKIAEAKAAVFAAQVRLDRLREAERLIRETPGRLTRFPRLAAWRTRSVRSSATLRDWTPVRPAVVPQFAFFIFPFARAR